MISFTNCRRKFTSLGTMIKKIKDLLLVSLAMPIIVNSNHIIVRRDRIEV